MGTRGGSPFDAPVRLFLVSFAAVLALGAYLSLRSTPSHEGRGRQIVAGYDPSRHPWLKDLDLSRATELRGRLRQRIAGRYEVAYTLSPELQQYATSLFERYDVPYGAVMMMEIPSGRVLVMAGRSGKDPRLSHEDLCLKAWAPAASVMKIVTSAALLSKGLDPRKETCYRGGHGRLRPEWLQDTPKDDTCEDLPSAFAHSSNQVFAKLARKMLTRNDFRTMAASFGYGPPLPFEFPVHMGELRIDDSEYGLAFTAAGFGHSTLSVYHALFMAGIVANDGTPVLPYVVEEVRDIHDGTSLELPERPSLKPVISPEHAAQIRHMMELAVTQGTAREGFYLSKGRPLVPEGAGGKTGTLARKSPEFLLYTWFVGLSPVDRPRVAIAVLVVSPLKWRIKASHAAAWILRHYWNRAKAANQK